MKKSYLKYIAGLLLFGSNGVVASFIPLSSDRIVFLRSVLGGILLIAIFFLTGNRFTFRQHRRDYLFIAVSGIAMAGDWLFLFEAYDQIGVSLSILINYTGPAIVIAFSPLLFGEKITPARILALAAALAGACLISGEMVFTEWNPWGLACAVLSAFCYAAMVLSDKKAEHVGGTENAAVQLAVTAIVVTAFTGFRHGFSWIAGTESWLPILWLGLINTGIGCFLYFSSIVKLPAQTVAVCGYLEPLSGVFFSALILRETMTTLQALGAVLIIGGALFGETGGKAKKGGVRGIRNQTGKWKEI